MEPGAWLRPLLHRVPDRSISFFCLKKNVWIWYEDGITIRYEVRKNGVYKKVVSKDGVIVGALLQGDLAYGGVLQQMIARKIDVRKVKKPLFEIDYSDFFHEKKDLEFAYV